MGQTLLIYAILSLLPFARGNQGDTVWYEVHHVRRLTDRLEPDTLIGTAFRTPDPDSLVFILVVRSSGKELLRRQWNEVYYGESFQVPRRDWFRIMRAQFDKMFRESSFVPPSKFGTLRKTISGSICQDDDPRGCIASELKYAPVVARWKQAGREIPGTRPGMPFEREFYKEVMAQPFDTARVNQIWDDIREHTPVVFTFDHGYEAHESVAWSPLLGRFVTLFTCC